MTSYPGINYAGAGSFVNKNPSTGIRYGIIPMRRVTMEWCEIAEPFYTYRCPYCGNELKNGIDSKRCDFCHKSINSDRDFDDQEPDCYYIDNGEYSAFCDSYDDIFITFSPYFSYAQFCSPCAPGACHLNLPLDNPIPDNKCYCFGHNFFENHNALYPVYSVETGEIIKGEKS
jgi:hypothetical protein